MTRPKQSSTHLEGGGAAGAGEPDRLWQRLMELPKVRAEGDGFKACCPAHDDNNPSLSFWRDAENGVGIKCYAECESAAVLGALGGGFTKADMCGGKRRSPRTKAIKTRISKKVKDAGEVTAPTTHPTPEAVVEDQRRRIGRVVAQWIYRNRAGDPVVIVTRFEQRNGGKTYRPASKVPGGWADRAIKPHPLYRLPELAKDPDAAVYVTEGEKCADLVASLGLVSTTSAGGAQRASGTDWTPLAGRDVIVLPDEGGPGGRYAGAVGRLLGGLDPAPRVRVIRLPDLKEGEDVEQRLEALGGDGEVLKAEILKLTAEAAETPALEDDPGGPVLRCLADIEPQKVRWLWPGRIPLGRITLLVGRPGEGKSFLTCDMAARVSTGTDWPDGTVCPEGSVLLVCAEDDPGDTIRPRLDAHHADVRRVHLLAGVRRPTGRDGEMVETWFTLADVLELESVLERLSDCKLVVVDPIGSYLGSGTDAHRDNEVRSVLAPIGRLAEKYGPAFVVVAHRRKGTGTNADELALGSRAFTGIARAVWHVTREEEDKTRRLLLPGKNNLGPEGSGLAFTIAGDPAVIAWEMNPVEMSADDQLRRENGGGEERTPGPEPVARNHAAAWLRGLLEEGAKRVKEIEGEGRAAGFSMGTLRRAKDELGITPHREGYGEGGGWWWELPSKVRTKDAQTPKGEITCASSSPLKKHGENGQKDLRTFGADSKGAQVLRLEHLCDQGDGTGPDVGDGGRVIDL
ncbi:MAG: AAA family ATPase [Phycisphaeraceae bacterium]